jgi:hypothetical protein
MPHGLKVHGGQHLKFEMLNMVIVERLCIQGTQKKVQCCYSLTFTEGFKGLNCMATEISLCIQHMEKLIYCVQSVLVLRLQMFNIWFNLSLSNFFVMLHISML